jgi:hypothetical protein
MVRIYRWAAVLAVVAGAALVGGGAAQAGPRGGKQLGVDVVKPGEAVVYTVTFLGGEDAKVTLVGDGSTKLALRAFDEDGNLVGADAGFGKCTVSWTENWTGKITVKVVNLGSDSNLFVVEMK